MRQLKTYDISRRLTAVMLCLCMIISIISSAGVMTAFAADTRAAQATQDIVPGSRLADPDTMDDYINRLLTDETGSRYAGRVWTDKTVFAYGDGSDAESDHFDGNNKITLEMNTDGYNGSVLFNSDFGHVFSALASSQVVNEYPPSPVDLVIVFDMSGSMGQDTRYDIDSGVNNYVRASDTNYPAEGVLMADRIANSRVQQTLDAINTTIDKLMAQNPQNRVAVCGYGENATVLMPLAHYRHVDRDEDGTDDPYLSVGGMETLYHPSDLVYRTPNDSVTTQGGGTLPAVKTAGWYWMNNRDTCYTVVVNAEYNTYTGVLSDTTEPANKWEDIENQTVSNNALTYEGERVKAFPGAWKADGKAPLDEPETTYSTQSVTVYQNASTGQEGWSNGSDGNTNLVKEIAATQSMSADDYVGYFTNTQGGIYLAYKQLADSTATTYTEELTNGVISTVARIPAAIIMSDGGANFSFNEMGITAGVTDAVVRWNSRYGQPADRKNPAEYISDDSWIVHDWKAGQLPNDDPDKTPIAQADRSHRLGGCNGEVEQVGDEWYNVFLPGKDTLYSDWKGLYGIYNRGADIYKDGTLSTAPICYNAGVLYSSDNNIMGTSGAIMEVLLTASYMNYVVKQHYEHGWSANDAAPDSRVPLSTYTMNVDTAHVPLWGRMRLYPTLNPKQFSLNDIESWVDTVCPAEDLDQYIDSRYGAMAGTIKAVFNNKSLFVTGYDAGGGNGFTSLKDEWEKFKNNETATPTVESSLFNEQTGINIVPITDNKADYQTSLTNKEGKKQEDTISVTNANVVDNIAYNNGFYDVQSEALDETFDTILGLILGNVFVPVSGDNDAGVGDSITYQDPLGEYMEIKDGSIVATPHHIDGEAEHQDEETTFDMSMLLFGEMHGLVRAGVYDYQWNEKYMNAHEGEPGVGQHGETPFPMGWYWGDDPEKAVKADEDTNIQNDGSGTFPKHSIVDPSKTYNSANEAREDGWVYRLNFSTLIQFVPIVNVPASGLPKDLSPQVMNTKYTIYRFAGTQKDRNALRRNPIYGEDVPEKFTQAWNAYYEANNKYPDRIEDLTEIDTDDYPGIYRLSDIRVWVEDTGDYTDTDGAFTPNGGYDRALYVNIPAAAIPTELATITLGPDGVLSYETNLGSDHPEGSSVVVEDKDGKEKTVKVTQEMYENYCYQSTPFRLFYAVGLEDDLILRDDAGGQVGVDTSLISPEYLQEHTDADTGNVWFISNYYSNTTYSSYATDDVSRTRGDPTVTFSPGADNRYYVFQKPLPLYAHAYRVSTTGEGYTGPVDYNDSDHVWTVEDSTGNSTTVWEDGNTGGANWAGGQFMGVYDSQDAFKKASEKLTIGKDGKQYIEDSRGLLYEYVDGGIIFSEEDLLDHVTTDVDGNVEAGSHSFSSDDYYFILLEFYVPYPGSTGKNNEDEEVPGTQGGHMVQWALARRGSEFGSGYASSAINNGDMLCWTDTNDNLNVEFAYVSKSDTGDLTRGEPTWEKLTYKDDGSGESGKDLRYYLEHTCGIDPQATMPNPAFDSTKDPNPTDNPETIKIIDQQVAYWTAMQENPQVIAALTAAAQAAETPVENLTKVQFEDYFQFAVATRPGGIRSGDMSNNLQYKGTIYTGGYYDRNRTHTSNTYYLPTISDNSGTDDNVIINNYLGNNGRLEIANETLHVTKLLVPPADYTLTDAQKTEIFNFQVSIQGVTGTRSAVKTEYNEYAGAWERELAYIDVLTDNSDLVQTNNSTRALFVLETTDSTLEGGSEIPLARQVVQADDGTYYYADDNGEQSETLIPVQDVQIYYMYLPTNGTEESSQHVHRLYQNTDYDGTDAGNFNLEDSKNGMTTFVEDGQHEITPSTPGEENRDSYREANTQRPAGTKTYWVQNAELIPREEVDAAEADSILAGSPGESGPATIALEGAGGTWTHDEDTHSGHKELTFHTFVIRKPSEALDSTTNFSSPYKTRTQYMTVTLEFGKNANENDGSTGEKGSALTEDDLYDKSPFGTATTTNRLRQITAEFTLRHGEGLMFSGLSGSDYKFVEKLTDEQVANGYTLLKIEHIQQLSTEVIEDSSVVTGDTGSGEEQANYSNTFVPGDISITKELTAGEGTTLTDEDRNSAFSFTLKLDPTSGVGASNSVYAYVISDETGKTVRSGRLLPQSGPADLNPAEDPENDIRASDAENTTWAFTLKGGERMTVDGLPTNSEFTYTITETTAGDGYIVTDSDDKTGEDDKDGETTVTGIVDPGTKDPVEVSFTNTKKKPEPVSITLPLTKTVTGEGFTWEDETFSFLVTPDENNPESDPLKAPKEITVSKPDDGSNTNTIDNIFDGLQFEKAGTYVYTVTEKVSDIPGISSDGKMYTVKVVVSEDYGEDPDNPVYAGKLTAEVTVTPDEKVTFENPYDEGKISVPLRAKKTFISGVLKEGLFAFELTGVSAEYDSAVMSVDNSERQNRLDTEISQQDKEQDGSELLGMSGEDATGSEGLENSMDGVQPSVQGDPTFDGQTSFANQSGEMSESNPDMNLEHDGENEPDSSYEIGLDADIMPLAAPPEPEYVEVPPLEEDTDASWEQRNTEDGWIDFGTVTFEQAGTYVYTLREVAGADANVRYSAAVYKITIKIKTVAGKLAVDSINYEVSPKGDSSYEPWDGSTLDVPLFINERETGSLAVYKTVTGEGDQNKDFQFTVTFGSVEGLKDATITKYGADGEPVEEEFTIDGKGELSFTLKHNEHLEIQNLPVGVKYTVTEESYSDYTTSASGNSGEIKAGEVAEARFVNDKDNPPPPPSRDYGNLTVTKTVTGTAGDTSKDWHFRVELSQKLTGQYGDMHFTNGVAEFTLKHGQSVTARNLPSGITYTVTETEANQDGYDTSSSGDTGRIPNSGTAKAEFVNDKDNPPPPPPPEDDHGHLTVTKTVTGSAGDTSKEWHFRVELSQKLTGQYGDMYFTNGVAEFTLKHGQSATALNLPEGITYTDRN